MTTRLNFVANKLDRRRKYYLVLDCETATLPFAKDLETEEERKNLAIAKPLIYDLGWLIVDANGKIYERQNFLISEIFSVPAVFNTAYYAHKRPIYIEKMKNGEIDLVTWETASKALENAMKKCVAVGAYNSMFDFKKALPFTELYISKVYSPNFDKWIAFQKEIYLKMDKNEKPTRNFEKDLFRYHNVEYPLFDLWGLSCEHILNCEEYKQACNENGWITASGKYYKTSAETAFRFISENFDFEESHTAIDDAEIESQLFARIMKKRSNFTIGIIYFPFRILGYADMA